MNTIKLTGITDAKSIPASQRIASKQTASGKPPLQLVDPLLVTDTVNTSGWATAIEQFTILMAQLPDVRQERIESLQQLIHSGSYQPAAHIIAGAIIAHDFGER